MRAREVRFRRVRHAAPVVLTTLDEEPSLPPHKVNVPGTQEQIDR
jgi:hypothetical protein